MHLHVRRVSQTSTQPEVHSKQGYLSVVKMEVECSSETSVSFYLSTWGYIPEGSTNHWHVWSQESVNYGRMFGVQTLYWNIQMTRSKVCE
jgi:hypothetical protein